MVLKFTSIIILVTFSFIPVAFCGYTAALPSVRAQLGSWFQTNVQHYTARKSKIDPALAAAEASPRIIKVNKNGGGDFKTITDALKSLPAGNNTKRVVIKIAGGEYTEKIKVERTKNFITFYGAPNDMPTFVYGGTALQYGTIDSASLIVEGDYFVASNIIIKNSAPPPDGVRKDAQAVALRVSGDKAAFYNCKLYGYQDTLCDDRGKHFFKDCHIEGTVDFIFGNAKTLYLNTQINVVPSILGMTVITAQGRKSSSEDNGYVFAHCKVTGTAKRTLLGRPWFEAPVVIFAYTEMSNVLSPLGWSNNNHPERERTMLFGEYKNTGPGSSPKDRASFVRRLSDAQARTYLSLDYIEGSKWLLPPPRI
ncbi:Pectinesterase, catalytic [Dillenia turbinata]|uniref:Pectinesterase n=1 Tax=Dillenia turbinata TaxID=194707 RepID=A0AAN8V9V1_9MAGN